MKIHDYESISKKGVVIKGFFKNQFHNNIVCELIDSIV